MGLAQLHGPKFDMSCTRTKLKNQGSRARECWLHRSTQPHHGNVNRRDYFLSDVKVMCHNMASRFSMHSENVHIFRKYGTAISSLAGEQRVHNQKNALCY